MSSDHASEPQTEAATQHALLTAGASVICLLLAEWIGLQHANLAVWTTFLVLVNYTFTRFQKGLERVIGRGLGILLGLVLTTWFHETAVLTMVLICVLLTFFFYLYFAGRLAYTFLQAGLYLVAMFQIGHSDPNIAVATALELFAAVVLGVAVADVMSWLFNVEGDLAIKFGETPLWPIRSECMSQSLMLAMTVLGTLLGAHAIGLPPENAAVSVMLLTVTPHVQAMILKGELRIVGAVLASGWAVGTFLIVGFVPQLVVLAGLLFWGQFVAAYLTRTGGQYGYAGMQMGLVLPMLIVDQPAEFGSLNVAIERLWGVLVGLAVSVVVAVLWPSFPLSAPAPAPPVVPVPPPEFPGEMDS